jgi:hypothetical protein
MLKEQTLCDRLPSCDSSFAPPPHSEDLELDAVSPAKRLRNKSTTRKIVLSEPDEELLRIHLMGRTLTPKLDSFLKKLSCSRKWMRKIYIPSNHENLAAAIVYTTDLTEHGLEITCELHVFLEDTAIVEKWYVLGENQQPRSLTREMLRPLDIEKVRLCGRRVYVVLKMPWRRGKAHVTVRTFAFVKGCQSPRFVLNPVLQMLKK